MAELFRADWEGSDTRVVAMLRAKAPLLIERLSAKLNLIMYKLKAHIVGDKLSGQVLNARSGTLRGSIRVNEATDSGETLSASVEGGGGPALYGRFHEFGTSNAYEIVPVNKKALAFEMGGQKIVVRSVMHPPIAERSFMRTGFEDIRPTILPTLREGIHEALKE